MAVLLVDIGNTALKAVWADGITLGKTFRYQGERMLEFIISLTSKSRPDIMVLSSVRSFSANQMKKLESQCDRLVVVEDIAGNYGLPEWITPDRVASIVASRYLFKGRSCTVFDFGSVLTVDVLGSDGTYCGGYVSPGCRTRFKALNRYSRQFPLLNAPEDVNEIGTDIVSTITSGVVSGIMFEIDGYLSRYPENISVFTGGDAIYFAKKRKNSIFVVCNLVLMGLALIALEYDKKD